MTRTYALKRLLEHGPMTRSEILDVMGGNRKRASNALSELCTQKIVTRRMPEWRKNKKSFLYQLADFESGAVLGEPVNG